MGDAFESTELAIFTLFGCFADLHYVSALNHGGGLKSAATVCVSCVCAGQYVYRGCPVGHWRVEFYVISLIDFA